MIDETIEKLFERLGGLDPSDPEYDKMIDRIAKLNALKKKSISNEAILATVTNLFGILLVLNHEKLNIISTRAWTLLKKQ